MNGPQTGPLCMGYYTRDDLTYFYALADAFTICDSYFAAVRSAPQSRIEAIDMGRRALHNEGSELLQERLADKLEIDFDTARRLFTRCGWEVAVGLFCSSLPQGYAVARCARLLVKTQALTRRVSQRVFETGQFLLDVLAEGGLEPGAGPTVTPSIKTAA